MTVDVSRRRVLEAGGTLLSGRFVTDSRPSDASSSAVEGWVTKGSSSDIAEENGTVESFRYFGSSLCNDGNVFACRTCAGVEFYLLVSSGSPSPTVGETYRFRRTGNDNFCGNFQVRLLEADSCGDTAATTTTETTEPRPETPADTPSETTDTPTEAPTDTPTDSPTDTPTETPTDTPTETSTETIDTPAETTETASEGIDAPAETTDTPTETAVETSETTDTAEPVPETTTATPTDDSDATVE